MSLPSSKKSFDSHLPQTKAIDMASVYRAPSVLSSRSTDLLTCAELDSAEVGDDDATTSSLSTIGISGNTSRRSATMNITGVYPNMNVSRPRDDLAPRIRSSVVSSSSMNGRFSGIGSKRTTSIPRSCELQKKRHTGKESTPPGSKDLNASTSTTATTQKTRTSTFITPPGARPSTAHRDHCIMALAESRGVAAEVGVCVIHSSTGECILSQVSDSQSYPRTLHKINLHDPDKILLVSSAVDSCINQLYQSIDRHFPQTNITAVPRRYFNEEAGKKMIEDYGLEEASTLFLDISSKYYCLAAVAAAFRYIREHEGVVFASHTVKFSYQGAEGTMRIDLATARNLELVSNMIHRNNKDTLLGALNHTVTPMGARLLRMNILQPSTDANIINRRLDAVQELVRHEGLMFDIQGALKPVSDLDNIIADIVKIPTADGHPQYAESKINNVIRLKALLHAIKGVAERLEVCKMDSLLGSILEILSYPKIDDFRELIQGTIHEDVGIQTTSLGIRHQRCYAIKAGVNGLLDVARQTYKETMEDIYELANEYSESSGLPIKLQFSATKGFFLCLSEGHLKHGQYDLPPTFINVAKKKKQFIFTTLELLQKNSRMDESLTEVYLMSDSTVSRLLEKFHAHIGVLHKVSDAVGTLDLLLSFGYSCSISEYVRPEFTSTLAIESGRHPIMDQIQKEPVIANDTYASVSSSFQVITGPNMSGKSTYIRQVALLTIMAQIGSFVPATYASFRICDQVFSRLLGADGCNGTMTSSFILEMREVAYILQNLTDTSLVIIDELGRGTAPYDALGITAAIGEAMAKSRAYCLFATHFHPLTRVLDMYPNVVNLQLHVDIDDKRENDGCSLSYTYTVKDGAAASNQNYGIKTAQMMGYPVDIITRALDIVHKMSGNDGISSGGTVDSDQHEMMTRQARHKVLYWFIDKITQLQDAPDDVLINQMAEIHRALSESVQ
ncbi:muts domain V-domain-containing protein [Dichotomocladium elegans]|nr:muts domain V-domain-containing protein [Dichotomocladium elegans]